MKNNTAIHVETQEQWNEINKLYNINFRKPTVWGIYGKASVIYPMKKTYCHIDYCAEINQDVISFADWKEKYSK